MDTVVCGDVRPAKACLHIPRIDNKASYAVHVAKYLSKHNLLCFDSVSAETPPILEQVAVLWLDTVLYIVIIILPNTQVALQPKSPRTRINTGVLTISPMYQTAIILYIFNYGKKVHSQKCRKPAWILALSGFWVGGQLCYRSFLSKLARIHTIYCHHR